MMIILKIEIGMSRKTGTDFVHDGKTKGLP